MQRGFLEERWGHTSSIVAMIHNSQCGKGKGKKPDDFNPMRKAVRRLSAEETTGALKGFLQAATKGKFQESNCKYELIDGAYVLVKQTVTKEVEE